MMWCGVEWCEVVWFGVECWRVIQENACIKDIFSVNSGFFDTRLKVLSPALLAVLVTNIRYE